MARAEESPERKRFERQLVADCIACKPGALDELLERYSDTIKNAASEAIREATLPVDRAIAEDLYQEFCVELVRNPQEVFGGFDVDEGRLASWLFTVAHHFCVKKLWSNELRWRRRILQVPQYQLESHADRRRKASDRALLVARLLETLDRDSRIIIQARFAMDPYDRELPMTQIAAEIGWAVSTTYRRFQSILEQLRTTAGALQDD